MAGLTRAASATARPARCTARPRAWHAGALLVCLLVLAWPAQRAIARAFELADVARIVALSDPQIAPGGDRVAVVVSTPNARTDRPRQAIELVEVASGKRRPVVEGRSGIASPRWSPDGKRLAFIADDRASGKPQIFVLTLRGGSVQRVTRSREGVDVYSWSPDGRRIAFIAQDPPPASTLPAHDKAFRVTDGHFLMTRQEPPWHLWVVPVATREARRLTGGDFSLNTAAGEVTDAIGPPAWSADGTRIAFTRYPSPYFSQAYRSVIGEVDAATGTVDDLVASPASLNPQFAPSGDAFAFLRPRDGDRNNGNAVYVRTGGETRDVTAKLARNLDTFAWMPDGGSLIVSGTLGTHSVLWQQPLAGPARLLDLGGVEANDGLGVMASDETTTLSIARTGAIAFIGSTATHPSELYVLSSPTAKPRRLTDVNAFIDQLELGRTQSIDWDGPDGFREDGVLTYPAGFDAGQRYPVVVVMHGGPMFCSNASFQSLAQLLSAAGFLVFQPNYRGSTNLGDAYQHAIYRDTGEGPARDILAGLAAVDRLGVADMDRIGVSGWSYGGFMTTWLTSHYDRWKAAVAGAPLTDWLLDYTISFYQGGDEYLFGSKPFTDAGWDIWRAQSPIDQVRNVRAPTLLLGDVMDPNVPLANAYAWYHALRDNGVPVEFYAYPETTHEPGDVVQIMDVYRRWVGWMQEHLQHPPTTPP